MRTIAFLIAVLASTGCIITGGDDDDDGVNDDVSDDSDDVSDDVSDDGPVEDAQIEANWTFTSAAGTNTGCPPNTLMDLVVQQVDAGGAPIGQEIIDRFNCEDNGGITDPLPPSRLSVYLRGNLAGGQTFTSFLQFVDLTTTNAVVNFNLISDGGFITFAWQLVGGTSGNPLTCAQVPDLHPTTGIGAISTVVDTPSMAFDDIFNCDDGFGTTDALINEDYVISIDAFNAQMESIAEQPFNQNVTILGPNDIEDLGTIDIPIAGL